MTESAPPRDMFLASLERCSAQKNFLTLFYENLLNRSDEIRRKFIATDFSAQHEMVLKSLRLAAGAVAGETASLKNLRERAESHDRTHHNVRPELYEHWLEAIIEAGTTCDQQWNESVESAWRNILGHVAHQMARHY